VSGCSGSQSFFFIQLLTHHTVSISILKTCVYISIYGKHIKLLHTHTVYSSSIYLPVSMCDTSLEANYLENRYELLLIDIVRSLGETFTFFPYTFYSILLIYSILNEVDFSLLNNLTTNMTTRHAWELCLPSSMYLYILNSIEHFSYSRKKKCIVSVVGILASFSHLLFYSFFFFFFLTTQPSHMKGDTACLTHILPHPLYHFFLSLMVSGGVECGDQWVGGGGGGGGMCLLASHLPSWGGRCGSACALASLTLMLSSY